MVVCASPAYLEQAGTPLTPQGLQQHNCIQFSMSSSEQWVFKKNSKRIVVNTHGNLHVNNGQALRRAACDGIGITMQPKILLDNDIKNNRLVELLIDYQLSVKEVNLVYLKDRYMPPKVRAFIDFMREKFS